MVNDTKATVTSEHGNNRFPDFVGGSRQRATLRVAHTPATALATAVVISWC